jgi:hypothetical protein
MHGHSVIMLSASVASLQLLLDKCNEVTTDLGLTLNCDESCCFAVGPCNKSKLTSLMLGSRSLEWRSIVKYPGITFRTGQRLLCDTSGKFYAASNCTFTNTKRFI